MKAIPEEEVLPESNMDISWRKINENIFTFFEARVHIHCQMLVAVFLALLPRQPAQLSSDDAPRIAPLNSSERLSFPSGGPWLAQIFVLNVSGPDDASVFVRWSLGSVSYDCLIAQWLATCTVNGSDLSASTVMITFTLYGATAPATVSVDFTSGGFGEPDLDSVSFPHDPRVRTDRENGSAGIGRPGGSGGRRRSS
jgi:hypothetical protein